MHQFGIAADRSSDADYLFFYFALQLFSAVPVLPLLMAQQILHTAIRKHRLNFGYIDP